MSEAKTQNWTVIYEINGHLLGSQVIEGVDADQALTTFENQYEEVAMTPIAIGPANGGTLMEVEPVRGWQTTTRRLTSIGEAW